MDIENMTHYQLNKGENYDADGRNLRNYINTNINTHYANIKIVDNGAATIENLTNLFKESPYDNSIVNIDLTDFNLTKATTACNMFKFCGKLVNISGFNSLGNITNMEAMFANTYNLTTIEGIENWNVSNVTSMTSLFENSKIVNVDPANFFSILENWDVSNVTSVGGMFANYYGSSMNFGPLTINFANWNLDKMTFFGRMFAYINMPNTDVVLGHRNTPFTHYYWTDTVMPYSDIATVNTFDMSNIPIVFDSSMYNSSYRLMSSGNINTLKMDNVVFNNPSNLSECFFGLNVNNFYLNNTTFRNISRSINATNMYINQYRPRVGIKQLYLDNLTLEGEVASNYYHGLLWGGYSIHLTNFKLVNLKNSLVNIFQGNINVYPSSSSPSILYVDDNFVTTLENADMSNVRSIYRFTDDVKFDHSVDFDLTRWNVHNITSMTGVFKNTTNINSININGWNLTGYTNTFVGIYVADVVNYFIATNIKFPNYDGSGQYSYQNFNVGYRCRNVNFYNSDIAGYACCDGCTSLTDADLRNTHPLSRMPGGFGTISYMFNYCTSLRNVYLNNMDITNIASMDYIFSGCGSLTNIYGLETLDTSNIRYMNHAFNGCGSLVNLSQFNTSNLVDVNQAFSYCNSLSDASIQNIVNMMLNSNITNASQKSLANTTSYGPFARTNISNTRYQNRWEELTAAGWTY